MKTRKICCLFILMFLILSLSGCGQNDEMMFEGSFSEIGVSFHWFFKILTPGYFGAISAAWQINSVVGFTLALIMTVVMSVLYIVLLAAFFVLVAFLAFIALFLTLIGYLIFVSALVFSYLFHWT